MKHYDYILAGGGAAGLSLAYHLMQSSLRDKKILIIDKEEKRQNDRTWCFWSERPTHFSNIYTRSWQRMAFNSPTFSQVFNLAPYQYNMLRGIDFYNFTRQELTAHANVDFLLGSVQQIQDRPDNVVVTAADQSFETDWVFDSLFRANEFHPDLRGRHYLKQHFKGWEIKTDQDCFDPAVPVMFDFRTSQQGVMRFIYILPFTPRQALVEYTLFSANLLTPAEYEQGLRTYLHEELHLSDYQITSEENGLIPMSDHPFTRRGGQRILNIGTKGGLVKPSTGYAFLRMQHDSAAIVRSLERHNHPFDLPTAPRRYAMYDSVLLQILYRHGELGAPIFTDLFHHNPIQRLFRFLDETGNLWENLQLFTTVPAWPFMRALLKLKLLGKV